MLDRSFAAYHALYKNLDLEFSICDDGSPEPVIAYDCIIVTLPRKNRALNPCVPINRAVNCSTSDVIVLTNPEVVHEQSIFPQMRKCLQNENDYIIAACKDANTGRYLCKSDLTTDYGRMPFPEHSGFHFCVMFYRSLWEKAGGFDEDYRKGQGCDDNDWLYRLQKAGANFIMRDDLIVDHYDVHTKWPHGGLRRNRKLLRRKWNL